MNDYHRRILREGVSGGMSDAFDRERDIECRSRLYAIETQRRQDDAIFREALQVATKMTGDPHNWRMSIQVDFNVFDLKRSDLRNLTRVFAEKIAEEAVRQMADAHSYEQVKWLYQL